MLILGLVCFLTFFAGLGRGAIGDSDEAFYAEASREMVVSGDWLTPFYNYELRFQKPILYYWLVSIAYKAAGVGEAAARFPSALAGLGLVILTYLVGRRWLDAGTGFFAATVVATSFGYFSIGRLSLPDLPLAFFIAATTWGLIEGIGSPIASATTSVGRRRLWFAFSGLMMGLGLLAKGPVAVALPVAAAAAVWWKERRTTEGDDTASRVPGVVDLLLVGGLALIVAAPWFITMAQHHGLAYMHRFFIGENLERFATDRYNEPRPLWFYVPIVLGGLMPWSPFILLWLPTWRRVFRRERLVTRAEWRAIIWALVPFVFYSASIGKQPRYILPMLPPMALLLARSVIARLPEEAPSTAPRTTRQVALAWCGTLCAVLFLILGLLLHRARPLLFALTPSLALVCTGIITLAAVSVALAAWSRRRWALPVTMAVASIATLLSLQFSVQSAADLEPVQVMARQYASVYQGHEPSATYRVFVRNLVFYTTIKQTDLVQPDEVVEFLRRPERVLCVITKDDLARLAGEHALKTRTLAEVQYFNPAGVRLRTLLWPDPSRDLETVLLVTNQ
ncbi:ArnT family glycosyltransferase [Luteitalea sp.]|uniref:ArnT family glycosyltransferase n=1 Tax=Luteitalea sp. TaxID=2004800 RepID=UPI0037CA6C11